MTSAESRWRMLLPISLAVVVIGAVAYVTMRPESSVTEARGPAKVAPNASSTSDVEPVPAVPASETASVPEGLQPEVVGTKAEVFEALIAEGLVRGGEVLVRAFDIHDGCMGVPRSQSGLAEWYADNASVPDVDYALMERRTQECIGVPALTFDTRRRMLQPLAESGDIQAQFLLATSFPYAMQAHRDWLRKSAEGGYSRAMVLLAQSLLKQSTVHSTRPEAYRWLTRASELNHPFAAAERDALEAEMSLGELQLARGDEPLAFDDLQAEAE